VHPTVRDIDENESEIASHILVAAFDDEPVFLAAFPDPAERRACLDVLFLADVRNACRYGGAHALEIPGAGTVGIAFWTYQPETERSDAEMAELGFTEAFTRWGAQLAPIGEAEAESHRRLKYLRSPWRYLAGIGILPEYQGRGFGTQLLHKVIADANEAGQSLALSTDRAINVKLYQRVGFTVVHHDPEASFGVPFWTMLHSSR
jgi:GNAT superfamily N-acetyltransferase